MYKNKFIKSRERINNIYGDDIGYVESFDFSKANVSHESRVEAISNVASICYDNGKIIGKEAMYDRLARESIGLPSSSFEFCPVLLTPNEVRDITSDLRIRYVVPDGISYTTNIERYGQWVDYSGYLLTNLRALINDIGEESSKEYMKDYTEKESELIKNNFLVFKVKVPIFIARQLIRSRASFQELSRRYVRAEATPFENYLPAPTDDNYVTRLAIGSVFAKAKIAYTNLIAAGNKPEVARQVMPVSTYTELWVGMLKPQFDNFIKLRTAKTAQYEIRLLAEAMLNADY